MQLRICERITDDDCKVKEGADKEGYYSFSAECGMLWANMTKKEKDKLMRSHDLETRNALNSIGLCAKLTKEEIGEWIKLMEWEAYHGICPAVIPDNLNKFRSTEAALKKTKEPREDAEVVSF